MHVETESFEFLDVPCLQSSDLFITCQMHHKMHMLTIFHIVAICGIPSTLIQLARRSTTLPIIIEANSILLWIPWLGRLVWFYPCDPWPWLEKNRASALYNLAANFFQPRRSNPSGIIGIPCQPPPPYLVKTKYSTMEIGMVLSQWNYISFSYVFYESWLSLCLQHYFHCIPWPPYTTNTLSTTDLDTPLLFSSLLQKFYWGVPCLCWELKSLWSPPKMTKLACKNLHTLIKAENFSRNEDDQRQKSESN